MRYFLEIAYKGTNYAGWQIQKNAVSVQQKLDEALATVLRYPVKTIGSGRTDTGVHCSQQFVHIDVKEAFTEKNRYSLNCVLPSDIAIKSAFRVKDTAHARFDALSRSYEYKITPAKDPFLNEFAWRFDKKLDIDKMNQACEILKKHTDFESFSKVHTDVKNFNCEIFSAKWDVEDDLIIFRITANRFLRGMVRAVGGTLIDVGLGKISISDFEKVILARDRKQAGSALPPHGLFLCKVAYPEEIFFEEC
ncbi:tRNA pseudouridine(38-40) synthase TruA [Cytophagaceae bacterium ABcell3]|nr:tRNA pseudouridine(38-40) synthase TruA [Cytophagaceae bacterium ABcell3]